MIRRFLSGLSWGAAASVVGLSLISQVAMPPNHTSLATNDVIAPENSVVAEVAAPAPSDAAPEAPAVADEAVSGSESTQTDAAGETSENPATTAESGTAVALPEISAKPASESAATQVVPQTAPDAVQSEDAPLDNLVAGTKATPVEQPLVETTLPEIQKPATNTVEQPVVSAIEAAPQTAEAKGISTAEMAEPAPKVEDAPALVEKALPPVAPAAPEAEKIDTVLPDATQQAEKTVVVPEKLPAELPISEPTSPNPVVPDVALAPSAEPVLLEPNTDVTLSPDTGLNDQVAGVVTGRLAVIEPKAAEPSQTNGAEAEPNLITLPSASGDEASPLVKFAQDFDGANGKPLFAILLVDDGSADLDRAGLAKIPLPVSFVIDPLAPNAKEAAAIYRAAGHEILMMASGIPQGATAGDVEQTFQAHAGVLPESVAVLDLSQNGFQDNRPLASMVVPVLGAQGRGLVTFDRGLNAADQVARRTLVPAATIFRVLDGEGENAALMRRYLDRAAFKAAQEGQVLVLGSARPETVSAILEWAVEGRSTTVTLAPATAVLNTN